MKKISFHPPAVITGMKEWKGMLRVISILNGAGYLAFLVGGAVRDMLLGEKPKDFDITTNARPDQIQALFSKSIPIGAAFGIITVIMDDIPYEVATFREERGYADGRHPDQVHYTDDPELDVIRRDFTVNAFLFDVLNSEIIDYTGGLDDMRIGLLRTVGNPELRFNEDALRILRAVRFASRLGYVLEKETSYAMSNLAEHVNCISAERIRDELEKMLMHHSREQAFRLLAETGLLKVVLPEIDALRGVEQPAAFHPEGDVFEHTMLMLTHIAVPTPALVWSVLLHDVGKAVTRTVKNGIAHFYGHESVGADMAEKILRRLRLPNEVIRSVVSAVRNHMRFASVDGMRPSKWKRIIADENFSVELELHRIDCISCHGLLQNYHLMLDRMRQMEKEEKDFCLPQPLITGKDLIALGMKPGVELGLLGDIRDMQLEQQLNTREEAIVYAKKALLSSSFRGMLDFGK